jgi:UDP-N-acetylmuramyl pentapeptide synthase
LLVDDGRTANPFGFEAMVKLSRSLDYKTKVLVFGGIVDLGAESKVIHEKLFILAESVFDRIVYVGEEGKMSALSVFGNRLVPANKALDYLEGIFHTTLVVVEGYVPASLKRLFESWKKE